MAEVVKRKDGELDQRTSYAKDAWTRCQDRWRYVNDTDKDNLQAAKEDTQFVWVRGKQWPDSERLAREANQRPWLEINQMPQFVNLVVNDQRQQRPAIKITPSDDDATKELAKIIEDHVRSIERDSKASAIYDSGFEHAVTSGRGYWRVTTDYENENSFNQVIRLKRIPDPLSVRIDPDYQEPDASDIEWGFVMETLTEAEFKRKYPGKAMLDFDDNSSQAIKDKWVGDNKGVIVADYYEKVYTKTTLVLLSNGQTALKKNLKQDEHPAGVVDPATGKYPITYGGQTIVQERDTETVKVQWHKVYGGGIIETFDWAGKYIPIICCIGVETVIEGTRYFQGLIRRARDVQTMFNFWQTKATESLAMAPNAQWLTPDGSTDGFETVWDTANIRLMNRLPYKSDPSRPAPTRIEPPASPGGVLEQANQCRSDFYTTIGIYPPNLAQESPVEVSGKALGKRERQGSQQTFHFADNLARAIAHTGCVIVDLIPKINDTARTLQQVSYDGKTSTAKVNQPNPTTGGLDNDLARGSYAVIVDVGPSYNTRKQETAEQMLSFMSVYPAAGPLIGDLLARSQDWDEADKIAARLAIMLPPQIQQMEQQAGDDPKYAALLMALKNLQQQSQQSIGQLHQALQQAQLQVQGLQSQVYSAQAQTAQAKVGTARAQTAVTQAQAGIATQKIANAKTQLQGVMTQHKADMQVAGHAIDAQAEAQRTGIEQFNADTARTKVALDFLLGLMSEHTTRQANQAAQDAAALEPEAEAIES